MKIVTWNVAGFRRSNSLDTWDYSEIDFNYFADKTKSVDPDVICLQEVLIGEVDQVEQFAQLINYPYYVSVKMSPDHTGTNDWIGLGIISKSEITDIKKITLPYPEFPLVFPDGKEAKRFDKMIISGKINGQVVATTQLQPIHYWGYDYHEEPALSYAKEISKLIVDQGSEITVVTGDFQISDLQIPMSDLYQNLKIKDSLPDVFTRKRKNGKHTKSDHILVKENYEVVKSEVVETHTDHFMCFVEIDY